MNAHRTTLVFAALLGSVLVSAPAKAAQRTFVASYGNDANTCSLVAPCRSFGIAIAAADPNGEVIALDSAGYGTFTVTKSVSVVAPPGVYAGIAVTNTDAVVVNAPGIRVTLRNLTINGVPGATGAGITLLQGASLAVEDCSIANVADAAIKSDVVSNVSVVRTTVRHNSRGIDMGAGTLTVADSLVIDSGVGIGVHSGGAATVTRTVAAFNSVGVAASSSIPGTSLSVTSSTITKQFGGVSVDAGAAVPAKVYVDIAGNTIAGNYAYGISFAGSSGASAGAIRGNVSGNQIVTNYFQGLLVAGTDTFARISGNFVFHNCCGIWQDFNSDTGTPYSLGDNYIRDNPSGDVRNVSGDSPL